MKRPIKVLVATMIPSGIPMMIASAKPPAIS